MPASTASTVQGARRRLGQVGVWLAPTTLAATPATAQRQAAARLEALGLGSLWGGERIGSRETFAQHTILLAATESLVIGIGVANMWMRRGIAVQAGAATLAEAYPNRFMLGVGVSHDHQVERIGLKWERPVQQMREYLDEMDAAALKFPELAQPAFPFILAALGPKMLELARNRAGGALTFLSPVKHTAAARKLLGPDKLLIVHQAVVLEPDPAQARALARENLTSGQTASTVYGKNFLRLGYTDHDVADGCSNRLIDDIVAWGDEPAIARRIQGHLDAGADHVLLHPITSDRLMVQPDPHDVSAAVTQLERLAPALPLTTS